MNGSTLLAALDENGIAYQTKYSMREHVSFRVESTVSLALFPNSEEQLCGALFLLDTAGVRTEILGRGSNVFFAEPHFEGAVVFTQGVSCVYRKGTHLLASCGVGLTSLAKRAAQEELSGLAFAFGIPGSVGGAVYMNAGAYGGSVSDTLTQSRAYDRETQTVRQITDHAFDYRHSLYMDHPSLVCLDAEFALHIGTRAEIEANMQEHMRSRREKQPLEYPSAGSYFKRPTGYFAGKLIEDCGLKGMTVGGAQVSEKHAGFVINRGGATASDILKLEELVRERVQTAFGVTLEREVRVIR